MSKDESKYRKRVGRPPWTNVYDTKVDVRISAKEDRMLNELAERHDESRSTIMRKALRDFYKFNTEDREED